MKHPMFSDPNGMPDPEAGELDIHDFELNFWLHSYNHWGPDFWGWSFNENETHQAIFMRVPKRYRAKGKFIDSTPEQRFFNQIRFPMTPFKKTVTFNFKKVGAQTWRKENDFFKRSEEQIKEAISKFPKYFRILDQLLLGDTDPDVVAGVDPEVIEVWKW